MSQYKFLIATDNVDLIKAILQILDEQSPYAIDNNTYPTTKNISQLKKLKDKDKPTDTTHAQTLRCLPQKNNHNKHRDIKRRHSTGSIPGKSVGYLDPFDLKHEFHVNGGEDAKNRFAEEDVTLRPLSWKSDIINNRSNDSPDNNLEIHEVIQCICAAILVHIKAAASVTYTPPYKYSIFNGEWKGDVEVLSGTKAKNMLEVPSLGEIYNYFARIYNETMMEYECVVVSYIYLERMIAVTNLRFRVCNTNWRAAILTCMLLASKVWDERAMSNSDFASTFEGLSLQRVNALEINLLNVLNYGVSVSTSEYTKYNSQIRAILTEVKIRRQKQIAFAFEPDGRKLACRTYDSIHLVNDLDVITSTKFFSPSKKREAREVSGTITSEHHPLTWWEITRLWFARYTCFNSRRRTKLAPADVKVSTQDGSDKPTMSISIKQSRGRIYNSR